MIPASNVYTSSEHIVSYCARVSNTRVKAKFIVPGNKRYPHGIMRYIFLSEYNIQSLLTSMGEYWTTNHPDVVYVPFTRAL